MLLSILKSLIALSGLSPVDRYPPNYGPNLKSGEVFDFIVVGGGSAGSVVASRLTENPQWRVLLLEAGGYPSGMSEIPAISFSLHDTDEDWQYKTEPSTNSCFGLLNSVCKVPRGKALGGSSTINLMMYTRSIRYDHDNWVKAGNVGWDYDSILKYYHKVEHVDNDAPYGSDGNLQITRYRFPEGIRDALENSHLELGYSQYREDKPIGFRDQLLTVHDGSRQNAAKAYLAPVKDRSNLYVATNAHVNKIMIDPKTLTAFGVEIKINDQIIKVHAKKEVVLSAGSIESPHILMNSGIGPKEHLAQMGIPIVKDLRVGDNLQDHLGYPFLFASVNDHAINSKSSFELLKEMYRYFTNQEGILSGIQVTNFGTYINTKNETTFPDIQYAHGIVQKQDPYIGNEVLRALGSPPTVTDSITAAGERSPVLLFLPILLHPKSVGHVRLSAADPFANPLITSNFLSEEDDLETLLGAVKHVQRLLKSDAFSSYDPKIVDLDIENCRGLEAQSDEFFKCAIRNIGFPVYHPVGTCKMGPASDPAAVVDPELRVHGVNNLRVIDASIIPLITSSNTNAPTLMIGEKGSDMIKTRWMAQHDEL